MDDYQKHFPVLSQGIYANTAASGLMYTDLVAWRHRHDQQFLEGGSNMKINAMVRDIPKVRETVGRFFHCKTDNIALVPNFSIGLNLLLEGLDLKNKVLLLEDDYPSVNWPFEDRGFNCFYVDTNDRFEDRIRKLILEEGITVFAFSVVQWVDGLAMDIEFLRELKKEHPGLLLIADGTQFCGTVDFNFEEGPFDVLGASAYKWLLAGYGNGFVLLKDGVEEVLRSPSTGFNAAAGDLEGKDGIGLAKRLEPGHLDTLNFGSLRVSLEFLMGIGMGKIERRLKELSQKAKKAFSELKLLSDNVVSKTEHSTIFNLKADENTFKKLQDSGVICSQRGGGVRVSFHFYNTEKDIDAIVKILKTRE